MFIRKIRCGIRDVVSKEVYCTVKDKEGKKKILYLKQAADTLIRHHKKIKAEANPFNPCYAEYFRQRAIERKLSSNSNATQIANSAGLKFIQPYAGLSGLL